LPEFGSGYVSSVSKLNCFLIAIYSETVCTYVSCEQVQKLLENVAMSRNDPLYFVTNSIIFHA